MNNNQKICLLVFVFSIVAFFISVNVFLDLGRWSIENKGLKLLFYNVFGTNFDNLQFSFNHVGILACGSAVASIVGYFILGDKKNN